MVADPSSPPDLLIVSPHLGKPGALASLYVAESMPHHLMTFHGCRSVANDRNLTGLSPALEEADVHLKNSKQPAGGFPTGGLSTASPEVGKEVPDTAAPSEVESVRSEADAPKIHTEIEVHIGTAVG